MHITLLIISFFLVTVMVILLDENEIKCILVCFSFCPERCRCMIKYITT